MSMALPRPTALPFGMAPDPDSAASAPLVGIIMGSRSDLRIMAIAADLLTELGVAHEVRVVSAHRTPDWMFEYARTAEGRGLQVIIAAAGGAAHLPGMVAASTVLPVLGVPIPATQLNGVDALLSIVQMPRGVPVGTLAIGEPGAANAALLAVSILGGSRPELRERLRAWRAQRTADVLADTNISTPSR
ncbi:MAG: phosphoribosylaminoimidazole carboxylase [Gemmatimonadetes bacterium]|nr:phosphoribosylaminoimidazole carboxylase [Gemmatimonadota bacterium]